MSDTAVLSEARRTLGRFKLGDPDNPKGRDKVQQEFDAFLEQAFDDQKKTVDQSWLELAYVLPRKALRLALTATKKEMGQVQQIVTAAAIAKDKRFPNDDSSITVKIPARMLGSYSAALILRPIEKASSLTDATPAS